LTNATYCGIIIYRVGVYPPHRQGNLVTTYHISFVTLLPVQQVGTVELSENEEEARTELEEKLGEAYPSGVEVTYFSTDEPSPEELELAGSVPVATNLN
jgi:hypothetical protein